MLYLVQYRLKVAPIIRTKVVRYVQSCEIYKPVHVPGWLILKQDEEKKKQYRRTQGK